MSEQYRPSNGTEGAAFHERWCCHCELDKEMNGTCAAEARDPGDDDWCEILGRSFRTDEPLPEWIVGADGPKCTKWIPMGTAEVARCDHTADMFEALP
jgi:hypothetical protein